MMLVRLKSYEFLLRSVIYVLPIVAFSFADYICIHWDTKGPIFAPAEYWYCTLLTTMVWSVVAERYEVTSISKINKEITGIKASMAASIVTYAILIPILFFVREFIYSRTFVLVSSLVLCVLTLVVRSLCRIVLRQVGSRLQQDRVVIVGAGPFAARAAMRIECNEFAFSRVIAHINLPGEAVCISKAPVYRLDELQAIEQLHADSFVVAIPPEHFKDLRRCISKLSRLCKPIRIIVNSTGGMMVHDRVIQLGRLQLLDLDPSPTPSVGYFLVKRVFDIIFSAGILIVLGLPMLLIALCIKVTSYGPVLFKQQRVGKNGDVFVMYKFRTMQSTNLSEGDTHWTTEDDPRRTRFGTFLRKTSLDELPQFLNVLKGEMSVVGPRPERPYFVSRFRDEIALYQARHRMNVGITGWAQVNGLRGDTSIQKRIRYDLYYLQHWSLLLDMKIIVMTVLGGFTGKGAY